MKQEEVRRIIDRKVTANLIMAIRTAMLHTVDEAINWFPIESRAYELQSSRDYWIFFMTNYNVAVDHQDRLLRYYDRLIKHEYM